MSRWLNNLQPWGAFLLRLALGVAMVSHGSGKVIPAHGLQGNPTSAIVHFSKVVASMGVPPWLGYVSALTEFVGGILVLLGLLTRLASLLIAVNMTVAILLVDRHKGYAGSEYAVALLVIALMLLFYGPGAAALDRKFHLA